MQHVSKARMDGVKRGEKAMGREQSGSVTLLLSGQSVDIFNCIFAAV